MAKKRELEYSESMKLHFERTLGSVFWQWLEQEMLEDLDKTANKLIYGELEFDNPQQFWELRAKAKLIKTFLDKPRKKLEGIQNVLSRRQTQKT